MLADMLIFLKTLHIMSHLPPIHFHLPQPESVCYSDSNTLVCRVHNTRINSVQELFKLGLAPDQ